MSSTFSENELKKNAVMSQKLKITGNHRFVSV
jgi:hypothetical protein